VLHAPISRTPDITRALQSPRLVDALLVAVTLVTNIGGVLAVGRHDGSAGVPGPLDLLLLALGPALLWWRRRFPTLVLAGCVAATWTFFFLGSSDGPVYLPMIVALVGAITHGARAAAYAVVLGTLAFRLVPLVLPGIEGPSLTSTTGLAAWLAFLVALGELLRHRRALTESRHQRLLASLDAQADQIRREAAEQRLSLARDLHDVLGHQLAVINIQAKAGLHLRASGKPGVTEALEAVQEASSQALDDVQAFLDSLGEPGEHAAQTPSPSLGDLDGLLAPARAAGLDVQLEVTGTQRRLPAPHDLVASRTVLESLTNVLRHAGLPRTWVRLDYTPTRLTMRIDNATPDRPGLLETPGGGRGLEGMRHRLAAHGGTLTAGPTNNHAWSVVAVLPVPKEHP
jgi:signal transduction histidine kinase